VRLMNIVLSGIAAAAFANGAVAANAPYSFSTGAILPSGFSPDSSNIANSIAAQLAGSSVSGTFSYDALSPATGPTSGGPLGTRGTVYGVVRNPDGTFRSTSFSGLSASVGGAAGGPFTFTDPRGFSIVGNDAFQLACPPSQPGCTPTLVDFYGVQAEPGLFSPPTPPNPPANNISGFTINVAGSDYSLYNARFFWIEGQLIAPGTTPIPDFLSSNDLLATPPAFPGRLALDFVPAGNPGGTQYVVFFDGLSVTAVPEPETYAMLMAGFGLLGFIARRRKKLRG